MVTEDWRLWAPMAAAFVAIVGEFWHARRFSRLKHLAFGPGGEPLAWTRVTPLLRVLGIAGVVWGFSVLATLTFRAPEPDPERDPAQHLLICWDCSPSMTVRDSGPTGDETRQKRAGTLVKDLIERVDLSATRVTIIAFYTKALPVLIESWDLNVISNILDELPLEFAFDPGKTKLQEGVEAALLFAKKWPPNSATVLVLSDGDTVAGESLPTRPPSVADVLVIGVGHPVRGAPIAGTTSRQDEASLKRLAVRLGGEYWNGNEKHVPSEITGRLKMRPPRAEEEKDLRDYAFAAVLTGSTLLSLLPLFLQWFGGHGRHLRQRSRASADPHLPRRAAYSTGGTR